MANFADILKEQRVIVADGAMGTMLFRRGLRPGDCPERLNINCPEIVEEVTKLYVEAGAELFQTNTFGGSPLKLQPYSLENKTEEINTAAVTIAKRASRWKAFVAGSCGPSGRILKPYGDTEPEEVYRSFERQMNALILSGADMISIETMTDLTEAKLAIKAAKDKFPSIPVSACMTFDLTPKGFFTIMGVTIRQAAEQLAGAGADIIGSNCGNGIENMLLVAEEFKKYTNLPILIRSNAGIPEIDGDEVSYPETPEFMAEKSSRLLDLGVKIIGGCCGTTPEHIAAVKAIVDEFRRPK